MAMSGANTKELMDLDNKKPLLPVKYDVIFRLFFADERNLEDLTGFLKAVLDLPDEDYQEIVIIDPHLLPEYVDDKLAIIDIKLRTKSQKILHIEVQLQVYPALRNRIIYYGAKLITEQIGSSDKYSDINKTISIIITDEILIPTSQKYHHRFTFFDPKAGIELTDIIEIYTIELMKLPDSTDGTALYDWAKFIAAETEEQLETLVQRNPEFGKPILKLLKLSADEQARDMFERREKGQRDFNSFVYDAEQKGLAESQKTIALKLIGRGRPIEEIIEDTGLSREEIEALQSIG